METMVKKSDCLALVKPEKRYTISVNGQQAVDAARAFVGSKCYKQILIGGKFAAQCEIVIDYPGEYNGLPNKWVAFSFIPADMVQAVFAWIESNGFSGCLATFENEECDGPKEFELVTTIEAAWPDESTTETLTNIHGDMAVIYYWDDSFEYDACRGYEIFLDGDREKGQGLVTCDNADTAYAILSRKGFRY